MKKVIPVTIETDEFFSEVGDEEIIKHLESKGYGVIRPGETSKYINFEKSMGTEPFYKLIVDAIEAGKLSLEMIVGHVATRNLMRTAEKVSQRIK